ncbi:MAG: c-type cytochrome [Bdellovibrionota bacterium]
MSDEPTRRSKPVEQVSLSVPFFVAALAFFLFTLWTVFDEYGPRRTWKQYQAQFTALETARLQKDIEAELARLQGSTPADPSQKEGEQLPPLPEIQQKLAEARNAAETPEFKKIESDIQKKERELFLATQDWKIAKSWDIEHAFFYEEALKHKHEHEIAELKAKLDKDAADIARTGEKMKAVETELADLRKQKDTLLTEVAKWEELEKTVSRELLSLQDKLARVKKPLIVPNAIWYDGTIEQVVLRGYHTNEFSEEQYTVDRCMTCHFSIDKAGYTGEDVPKVLETHPDREALLGKHPVKQFACTPCHQGQGVAVSTTTAGHTDLDEAHGLLEFWEHPVLGFVQSGNYHDYKEERDPTYTQASCFKCHSKQYAIESPHAEVLNAGREYVTKLGCWGCHNMKDVGDGAVGFTGKKVGPSLARIAGKVSADWIVSWVDHPQAHLPRSRMPHYEDFGDPAKKADDLKGVAAFLLSQSEKSWPAIEQDKRPESFFRSGNAGRGEKLFKSVGCMGCHALGERPENWGKKDNLFFREFDVAPDLYNTGNKIKSAKWIYHWVKDPQSYDPTTIMPSLRLSDQEALDITAFLVQQKGKDVPAVEGLAEKLSDPETIKRGEWVVRDYGCYGCHQIKGMENEGKLSVELTAFGNKKPYELAFGTRTDVPGTWEDWTLEKLRNPRGFQTERQLSKMPSFHFSEEGAHAIRVLLKGFNAEHVGEKWLRHLDPNAKAAEEGRQLVEQFNCKGCHVVDHKGGRILAYLSNPQFGPPQLNNLGEKLQPEWFYNFLLDVKPVRTWLDLRMPSFPLDGTEARKIVQYFGGKAGDLDPFTHFDPGTIDPENVKKGKQIYETYRCTQCHFNKTSGYTEAEKAAAAPSLQLAHKRLKPEWFVKWIGSPGYYWDGVRMPSFFYLETDKNGKPILDHANQYAAQAIPQLEALRDFLLVYGREGEVQGKLGTKRKSYSLNEK